jgi:hypothetical protein
MERMVDFMKEYKVALLVEFESGVFNVLVNAKSKKEAEIIAKNKLIHSYPVFKNEKIMIYDAVALF